MTDFSPPPDDIWDQLLAAEQEGYRKQGRLLRFSVATNGALVFCVVGSLAVAGWALTKERDHIRLIARDEIGIYHVLNVTPTAATSGERITIADRWIRDVMELTTDRTANRNMRIAAVRRLNLPPDEKDRVLAKALSDIDATAGFASSIGRIDFKPKGSGGTAFDATFAVETVDMRPSAHQDPRKIERYVADIQFVEVDPTLDIPDGLLIAPFEPRKLEDVK